MEGLTIISNHHPRDVLNYWAMDSETAQMIKKEFDYINWDDVETGTYNVSFAKYKGQWYDLDEFSPTHTMPMDNPLRKWGMYSSDSYFSGIVFSWVPGTDFEQVVFGRYYC